ncbi:MAG: hypothetical protein HPY50_20225 [Firmicutes bacterium]|nr:hypothetical protein [Bacillota bacterium]
MPQLSTILKYLDFQIAVSLAALLAAWKWSDWKNWKKYYSTILYYIIISFLYAMLTYNHPLWEFKSPLLKTTFSDILLGFVCSPALILLYLTFYPHGLLQQVPYLLLWVLVSAVVELTSFYLGFISFQNGWSIWWSTFFYLIMFIALRLHYQKPLWAWVISVPIVTFFLVYFKVPLSSMK